MNELSLDRLRPVVAGVVTAGVISVE